MKTPLHGSFFDLDILSIKWSYKIKKATSFEVICFKIKKFVNKNNKFYFDPQSYE